MKNKNKQTKNSHSIQIPAMSKQNTEEVQFDSESELESEPELEPEPDFERDEAEEELREEAEDEEADESDSSADAEALFSALFLRRDFSGDLAFALDEGSDLFVFVFHFVR